MDKEEPLRRFIRKMPRRALQPGRRRRRRSAASPSRSTMRPASRVRDRAACRHRRPLRKPVPGRPGNDGFSLRLAARLIGRASTDRPCRFLSATDLRLTERGDGRPFAVQEHHAPQGRSRTRCASKLFSKLAREITVAAKLGLPDPAMNARLRLAMLSARAPRTCRRTISSAPSRRRPAATARTTRRSATRAMARAASP